MALEPLRFERFDRSRHDRASFDCGVASLNEFFKRTLNQQMKRGITVGYVLAAGGAGGRVAGYFTLSAGRLPITVIPPGHGFPETLPLPATLLGRLAVDVAFRGRGLGADLLVHALRIAAEQSEHVASAVIEVDAIDNNARQFYERFGFKPLPDQRRHLYLPMDDAVELVRRAGLG